MNSSANIASVSATLQYLLQTAITTRISGANVSIGMPYKSTSSPAEVQITLYRVTPSTGYRSADLPLRNSKGELLQSPQLGVELDYLLSFSGDEQQAIPQCLLGETVLTLAKYPILDSALIETCLSQSTLDFLAGSDLAEQIEQVSLSMFNLSTEEQSKLWSVFFQAPYRLSVGYHASVVLINDNEQPIITREVVQKPVISTMPIVNKARRILHDNGAMSMTMMSGSHSAHKVTIFPA